MEVVDLLKGPAPTKVKRVTFAKLKKLVETGEDDLEKSVSRLADVLKSSGEQAELQVDIVRGRTTKRWTVSLEPKSAAALEKAARRPDLWILVSQGTWQQIAEGALSPVDAFLSGELRIRGDTELARRLLKRAGDGGETDVCC
jgi:putative sterol carrier protein